jgi:peroxidase
MIDKMASLYKSPDEVDLYMAGMSERVTSNGGILGHTFSHIIADQFARLKEGDRFFYELGGQPSSFTIGNTSLLLNLSRFFLFTFLCFQI